MNLPELAARTFLLLDPPASTGAESHHRLAEAQVLGRAVIALALLKITKSKGGVTMNWKAGVCGGLIAGLVFGIMMGMMGMLGMVAQVVRSDSVIVGFIYHLFNSAVIGALFVPLFGRLSSDKGRGLAFGLIYGGILGILYSVFAKK